MRWKKRRNNNKIKNECSFFIHVYVYLITGITPPCRRARSWSRLQPSNALSRFQKSTNCSMICRFVKCWLSYVNRLLSPTDYTLNTTKPRPSVVHCRRHNARRIRRGKSLPAAAPSTQVFLYEIQSLRRHPKGRAESLWLLGEPSQVALAP